MRRSVIVAAVAACLGLASPALAAGFLSYGPPRIEIHVDGHGYHVAVNKKENLILIQANIGEAIGGKRPDLWPVSTWRAVAEYIAVPLGCGISDVHSHGSPKGGTWEAEYVCPEGVNLRQIFIDQHKNLEGGGTLKSPAPQEPEPAAS